MNYIEKKTIYCHFSSRSHGYTLEYLFKANPFEFIISSEDVELKKSNPLPYLKAIKLSGIKINKSIVFEDSNPGLHPIGC